MGRVCRNFAIAYVVSILGFMLIDRALTSLVGRDLGMISTIVSVMNAAWFAGWHHGNRTETLPSSTFSWTAAFWMLCISLVIAALPLIGMLLWLGVGMADLSSTIATMPGSDKLLFLAYVALVHFLLPRMLFASASRNAAKIRQREIRDTF